MLKKAWVKYVIYFTGITILLFVTGEITVRLMGFKAYEPRQVQWEVITGEQFFAPDKIAGFNQRPGSYKVLIKKEFQFNALHDLQGCRVTMPPDLDTVQGKPEIWIMGGSCTYGWSVNNNEAFPWLIQQLYPEYKVVNWGISGGSTVQMLMRFKGALQNGRRPAVVVLMHADVHQERNVFSRHWQLQINAEDTVGLYEQPYARLKGDGLEFKRGKIGEYQPWPLSGTSAFMFFIEMRYNGIQNHNLRPAKVTGLLLDEFQSLSNQNGIQFMVAGITPDDSIINHCKQNGIIYGDALVDLNLRAYNNEPYDKHPSAYAHAIYAQKLMNLLQLHCVPGFERSAALVAIDLDKLANERGSEFAYQIDWFEAMPCGIAISGWAANKKSNTPTLSVFLMLEGNGTTSYWRTIPLKRPDVGQFFSLDTEAAYGFQSVIPTQRLAAGHYRVGLVLLSGNRFVAKGWTHFEFSKDN